jgi:hypothetical protein
MAHLGLEGVVWLMKNLLGPWPRWLLRRWLMLALAAAPCQGL